MKAALRDFYIYYVSKKSVGKAPPALAEVQRSSDAHSAAGGTVGVAPGKAIAPLMFLVSMTLY